MAWDVLPKHDEAKELKEVEERLQAKKAPDIQKAKKGDKKASSAKAESKAEPKEAKLHYIQVHKNLLLTRHLLKQDDILYRYSISDDGVVQLHRAVITDMDDYRFEYMEKVFKFDENFQWSCRDFFGFDRYDKLPSPGWEVDFDTVCKMLVKDLKKRKEAALAVANRYDLVRRCFNSETEYDWLRGGFWMERPSMLHSDEDIPERVK